MWEYFNILNARHLKTLNSTLDSGNFLKLLLISRRNVVPTTRRKTGDESVNRQASIMEVITNWMIKEKLLTRDVRGPVIFNAKTFVVNLRLGRHCTPLF